MSIEHASTIYVIPFEAHRPGNPLGWDSDWSRFPESVVFHSGAQLARIAEEAEGSTQKERGAKLDPGVAERPIWVFEPKPGYDQVGRLDSTFRELLQPSEGSAQGPWSIRSYKLADHLRSVIQRVWCDRALPGKAPKEGAFQFEMVPWARLHLFPAHTGALVFQVDWALSELPPAQGVSELSRRLSKAIDLTFARWSIEAEFDASQEALLPPAVAAGCWKDVDAQNSDSSQPRRRKVKNFKFGDLVRMLIRGDEEGIEVRFPSPRVIPHTYVQLRDASLTDEFIADCGYWLSHGFADTQRPPAPEYRTGERHQLREGRDLFPAREGVAFVCRTDAHSDEFARSSYVKRALGVYAWLTVHAHVERFTLSALMRELSAEVSKVHGASQLAEARDEFAELALRVTRYTTTMVGADCGGQSDYSAHFTGLRRLLGTSVQLAELRAEVAEVLRLADAGARIVALEGQTQVLNAQSEIGKSQAEAAELARRTSALDGRFQRFVGILGAIGVAFGAWTGILGINTHPGQRPWGEGGGSWAFFLSMTLAGIGIAAAVGAGIRWLWLRAEERESGTSEQ